MEDRFQVGVITSTHGIKGEVKVFPTTDNVKRFKKNMEIILPQYEHFKDIQYNYIYF